MFVDPNEKVAVTRGDNTIFIRAKMDLACRARVQDELAARGLESINELEMRGIGGYRLALMVHNIVGWEGPAFAGVACTRGNIMRLDPDDDLVEAVAAEIGERNAPKEAADPN